MYRIFLVLILCAELVPSTCGTIAFATNRDGDYEVYVMDENGGNETNLTHNPGNDRDPAWSPDGKKIAFTSDRDGNNEIYVMDYDGENQRRLTYNPGSDRYPAWSADGKIAFTSDRDGNDEIYVMDYDGENQRRLTYNLSYDSNASWSPDGKKIAFDSSGLMLNRYPYDIYIMDSDGSHHVNLTHYLGRNSDPAWSPSPDGKIAFVKRTGSSSNIFVMDADGRNQVNITDHPSGNWNPAWSSDGEKIVFASDRQINIKSAENPDEDHTSEVGVNLPRDIYVMNSDGTSLKRLTNEDDPSDDMFDDTYPAWCPSPKNVKPIIYLALVILVLIAAFTFLRRDHIT